MSTEINKNISASFAVRSVKNVIHMYTTLSDRLKQAGIKENKPKPRKNGRRNKKNQKGFSKACLSSSFQRTKKFRRPLKHFVTPYIDKSAQNETPPAEILAKQFETVSDIPETEENADKETIFVSLDFIEDCQNYKKKVRKQNIRKRKSLRSVPSHPKGSLDTAGSSRKSINSADANPWEDRENGDQQEENKNERVMTAAEKELSEALQCVTPLLSKLSSDDIAKIDKKYLDSILTFATKLEGKQKKEGEGESKPTEPHPEAKKKLTGRDFFELKQKTKECQEEGSKASSRSSEGEEAEWKDSLDSPCTDSRIVRELTKSEEHIKLKKGKNLFDQCYNKMETKTVTHSKPDINDVSRKKRKPRNKFIKANSKEFVETSLPSEMSRVADVKEIWRRKTLVKKSENSLTSHSSCTVPEIDEYPASKNLESYKHLKKLVEEEIANISKKSENTNNTGELKTKESNPKPQLEQMKKPPLGKKTAELPILKRRLLQAEGKIEKPELLNLLGEDMPKEANPKLVNGEDKAKNGKIPSKIIENWSILNRLEQAFLGLGTPTFPEKNGKSNLKPKHLNSNEDSLNDKLMKETKKLQKYKDALAKKENKGSPVQKNAPKTLPKKTDSGTKVDPPKEGTAAKPKKNGKGELPPQLPERNTPKPEETVPKQKKKLRHSPDGSPPRKPSISRATRRVEKELIASQTRLCIKGKYLNMAKKSAANPKKGSAETLERKKTFDVIPAIDESKIQPRRSKSCGINDTSLEGRFSQTRTQDSDVFSKDGHKLRSKSIENDTKIVTAIPKRLAKKPIKGETIYEQPSKVNGNLKSVGEKECFKGSRETSLRTRGNQSIVKNLKITEELPIDVLSGSVMSTTEKDTRSNNYDNRKGIENDSNNAAKERAVKKRSILSVNANQHCEQSSRKLLQIEEKGSCAKSLENVYRTSQKEFKSSYSNTSIMSTGIIELVHIENEAEESERAKQQGNMEISQRSTTSTINNPSLEDNVDEEQEQTEWGRRRQQLWEQDMNHYRSIVKEIMSQYQRIDGFLKQNEQLTNFTNNSIAVVSDDLSKSENDPRVLDIDEYRKKIITEYNELPIFEYKSKMEQSKEGSCSEGIRKRNLLVVRDLDADADVDVKDYQPKIQQILDSQLYVDRERLEKRYEPKRKFSEKISSLQDIVLRKNESKAIGEEWQRSSSTPRAFQLQRSYVVLADVQMPESQDHGIDNVTSESTTFYGPDTENESAPEISGF